MMRTASCLNSSVHFRCCNSTSPVSLHSSQKLSTFAGEVHVDLYSRRSVGWEARDRMKKALAISALNKAIAIRQPRPGLIQHLDRGSHYASDAYRKFLKAHHIIPSMSGKGNCYDNAMVETGCTTIKAELI